MFCYAAVFGLYYYWTSLISKLNQQMNQIYMLGHTSMIACFVVQLFLDFITIEPASYFILYIKLLMDQSYMLGHTSMIACFVVQLSLDFITIKPAFYCILINQWISSIYASVYINDSLFCCAAVFGLYYYWISLLLYIKLLMDQSYMLGYTSMTAYFVV